MADWVIAAAAVSAAAVSAASAVSSAQTAQKQGRIAREQAEIQAQQYADQREVITQQATQEEATRLVQLNRTLGAARAIRAGRGLTLDSVGEGVIENASIEEAKRDLDTIAVNAERERRSLGLASYRALLSGTSAQNSANAQATAGYAQAFGSAVQGGIQGYNYLSTSRVQPERTTGRVAGPV
jgi:flagellar capping protein FliD